jgi:anti-anti-sigma factor
VRVAGELDLPYAARLEDAIEGEITRGHRRLVIDLSAATFLDCASIGALLRGVAPLRDDPEAAVVLAGATGIVKRLLDLLHLDRLFDILPDLENATEHATAADRQRVDGWRTYPPRRPTTNADERRSRQWQISPTLRPSSAR